MYCFFSAGNRFITITRDLKRLYDQVKKSCIQAVMISPPPTSKQDIKAVVNDVTEDLLQYAKTGTPHHTFRRGGLNFPNMCTRDFKISHYLT